jgi:hypothetical protein
MAKIVASDGRGSDLRRTSIKALVWILLWLLKDFRLMFRWFEQVGYYADIEACRREHPGLLDMKPYFNTLPLPKKDA